MECVIPRCLKTLKYLSISGTVAVKPATAIVIKGWGNDSVTTVVAAIVVAKALCVGPNICLPHF